MESSKNWVFITPISSAITVWSYPSFDVLEKSPMLIVGTCCFSFLKMVFFEMPEMRDLYYSLLLTIVIAFRFSNLIDLEAELLVELVSYSTSDLYTVRLFLYSFSFDLA